MSDEIPPPPKVPSTWPSRLKKWGGLVSTLGVLIGAGVGVWKTIAYIDELHDTIGSNKAQVVQLRSSLDEDFDELEGNIDTLATAIRAQRDHDREVITNLRIAVAALQAADAVREGRGTYEAGTFGTEPARISARVRRQQADEARRDAAAALNRARAAQASDDDPLSALEGL